MTQPDRSRPPRRANADYRWTRGKIHAFIQALVVHGSVAGAAREVGMSRQSAYRLRARVGKEFGKVWDEGLLLSAQRRRMQGDRFTSQGDRFPAQGDRSLAQGDRFRPQSDTSGTR